MRSALIAVALALVAACQAAQTGPYSPPRETERNTTQAEQLNRDAADLITSEPAQAEALLRAALTADIFFGPAHNNLGVVFLGRGQLYEAANEFEWARKLMPGHPDPRVNLALCMERAGRVDDAIASYEAALEVWPDYLPAVQGIALATVRAKREDARLAAWLACIAAREKSASWQEWARREQVGRR